MPASQLKESEEQISVIPNPAQDLVSVLLPGEHDAYWTIDLFSAHGVGVKTLQVQGSQVEIKLQGLPSGLYFIRASQAGSGESYQQQLIIR
ncbi:MAG: T9SS type A sorting domain-containing protein [bacterium]|nr:T9SS type A sorting domain-containing protein [bacterium]